MLDTYGLWTMLAWMILVLAGAWVAYLRINRLNVTWGYSLVSCAFIVASLVSILAIKQSMLPVGILCCALATAGIHTTKLAATATLVVVVALNYLQTLEPSWQINTSSHDPAIVAVVGFLFVSLRVSRLSHQQLREEFHLAEQNQQLRERNLQEEFRTQVAANLHDLIGHDLTVINIRLQKLSRDLKPISPQAAAEVHDLQKLARASIAHLREVVEGFNTVDIESQLEAIPSLLSYRGIQAHITVSPETLSSLSPGTLTTVHWILLEAVTNILKHSGARNCWITLKPAASGDYTLDITDDGVGLGELASQQSGAGLSDMNTRAQQIGGRTIIKETPGGGTHVRTIIPAHNTRAVGR